MLVLYKFFRNFEVENGYFAINFLTPFIASVPSSLHVTPKKNSKHGGKCLKQVPDVLHKIE